MNRRTGPDTTGPLLPGLPARFRNVPYVGARHPGSRAVAERPGLDAGANCQLYAYAVLAHFGAHVPPLRSDDLWDDLGSTLRVPAGEPFEPLDLLLFNAADDAYGAHVGVWAGPDSVLHLCAEAGRPALWTLADFAGRPRYRRLVGAKRVPGALLPAP